MILLACADGGLICVPVALGVAAFVGACIRCLTGHHGTPKQEPQEEDPCGCCDHEAS